MENQSPSEIRKYLQYQQVDVHKLNKLINEIGISIEQGLYDNLYVLAGENRFDRYTLCRAGKRHVVTQYGKSGRRAFTKNRRRIRYVKQPEKWEYMSDQQRRF